MRIVSSKMDKGEYCWQEEVLNGSWFGYRALAGHPFAAFFGATNFVRGNAPIHKLTFNSAALSAMKEKGFLLPPETYFEPQVLLNYYERSKNPTLPPVLEYFSLWARNEGDDLPLFYDGEDFGDILSMAGSETESERAARLLNIMETMSDKSIDLDELSEMVAAGEHDAEVSGSNLDSPDDSGASEV